MTKRVLYTYLGTNGTITSSVHLEDVYYIRKIKLIADFHKMLTNNNKDFYYSIIVNENELNDWYEVEIPD